MTQTPTAQGSGVLVLLGILQAPSSGFEAEQLSKHDKIDADCGHRCFISPEGAAALRRESLRTTCLRCVDRDAGLRGKPARAVKGAVESAARDRGVTPEEIEAAAETAVANMGGTYVREAR